MAQRYEELEVEEDGSDEESSSGSDFSTDIAAGLLSKVGSMCGCCCCCNIILLICAVVSTFRVPSCPSGAAAAASQSASSIISTSINGSSGFQAEPTAPEWTQLVPAKLMLQSPPWWVFQGLFYRTVDVFDAVVSNTTRIGYWGNADAIFTNMFSYQDTEDAPQLVAKEPWGFYWGKKYELSRCGDAYPEFVVREDYWNEPWFQFFGQEKEYYVTKGGEKIATASQSKGWGVFQYWRVEVKGLDGTIAATLDQDFGGWFTPAKWYIENLRPDIIPNAVVSFLAAVFETQKDKTKSSSSSSSSSSHSSKR